MARELAARGLGPGDRLAIYLPNRIEYIDLFLACTRLGVIVVPINVLYRDREMNHILGDATPKAVVVADDAAWGRANPPAWGIDALAQAASASRRHADRGGPRRGCAGRARLHVRHDRAGQRRRDHARQPLRQRDRCWSARGASPPTIVSCWRSRSSTCTGSATASIAGCCRGAARGCSNASTMPPPPRPCATSVPRSFSACRRCMCGCWRLNRRQLARLAAHSGSASRDRRRFRRRCSRSSRRCFGHRILERYGMTETLMTLGNPYDGERRAGTVGLPFPGVSIRLRRRARADGSGRRKRRALRPVADRVRRLLESPGRHRRGVQRRLVQDRRHRRAGASTGTSRSAAAEATS